MARSIADIKKEITDRWMADEVIQQRYGFEPGTSFDVSFSVKVAIESTIFYIIAVAAWTLEKLFDLHRAELTAMINNLKPHSLRWYVSKAKAFMIGHALVTDADYYDTSGLTDEQIKAAQVVKYAAAVEKSAVVYLKIATDNAGEPAPLPAQQVEGFKAYIGEVKDAGVVVEVINELAEHFRLSMTVYYDPMVMDDAGMVFSAGTTPVQDTIRRFIKDLPFNGEYRNVALVDALQQIEGVVIPELHLVETSRDGQTWEQVNARSIPYSGYYKVYNEEDLNITFIPYQTVSE
jgi:hypothetical protein